MKSALFARPNLKLFLLGAVLIVVVEHFISANESPDPAMLFPSSASAAMLPSGELEKLIDRALEEPSSENYLLISDCLLRRGDTKRALLYLRKASFAARLEEGQE